MASAIATRRLRKELLSFQKDPPPGIIAEPEEQDILTWHFAVRGPVDTPYHNGLYIGKLVFPSAYPMKAPKILMLTPSARFVVNSRICMSMSDFHPELWNPSWSVATILTGVVSFMTSEEVTTGGIKASAAERKRLASISMEYNQTHFSHLFQGDIVGALARADEAREKAEKERTEALARKQKTQARGARQQQQQQQPKKDDSVDQQQQQHGNDNKEEPKKELTPEEAEKRRLKNAKKRAKQKAKKKQAAAVGAVCDGDDKDTKEQES